MIAPALEEVSDELEGRVKIQDWNSRHSDLHPVQQGPGSCARSGDWQHRHQVSAEGLARNPCLV
jgi:hypothetical protein